MSVLKFSILAKAECPTVVFALKTCYFVQVQCLESTSKMNVSLMSRRGAEAFTASESATSFAFHIEIDLLFVWMASKMKEFALLILFAADRLDLLRFGMDGIHAVGGRPQ